MRAWVAFLEEFLDWMIDARRRWREGDPPAASGVRPRLLGWVSVAVTLALVLQHLLGT